MNLQQSIDLDRTVTMLDARLGPVLDAQSREALNRVSFLMSEIRHFAVCWADAPEAAAGLALCNDMSIQDALRKVRESCIDRLVQTIRPE